MSGTESLDYVLDAYAFLAHLGDEPGAERVRSILKSAERGHCRLGLSIINLGEVAYIVEREQGVTQTQAVLAVIQSLPVELLPVDDKIVLAAAHLKANYRISYADAFAAASAQSRSAKLLTGDPEFTALDGKEITVEWLKP